MNRLPLLDPNRSYIFSNYFELGFTVDDLIAEFGYSFERKFLALPQYPDELDRITDLKQRIEEILHSTTNLIVIEAKQADINRGFTQLATEMIALDQWIDSLQSEILGAVTTGNVWQFGICDRQAKSICQGINLYRVTEELEIIIRILLARLNNKDNSNKNCLDNLIDFKFG